MIFTLTLNPAVDLYISLKELHVNEINRSDGCSFVIGGKGINVSRILKTLGTNSKALGFVGGFTGQFIKESLNKENIDADFINISNITRINVKINDLKHETAINNVSPVINEKDFDLLIKKLSSLTTNDFLICSGALPSSISLMQFKSLLNTVNHSHAKLVVDMSGEALKTALDYHPFLIKPNDDEINELAGEKLKDINEVVKYCQNKILPKGVENVLISLGEKGALLLNKDNYYHVDAPKGKVISTVGAGDSLLAGYIHSYLSHPQETLINLKEACVVGSATAFSLGLANIEKINEVRNNYIKRKE